MSGFQLPKGTKDMRTLQEEFSFIEIGQPFVFRNLTLFPLTRRNASGNELDYCLLEDGIAHGKVHVREVDSDGSIPELRLENEEELPVLILDGEELVGAKQNRVLNLTVLAPAKQTILIPVSCVEAGRWKMASADLRPTDHVMHWFGRAGRTNQVTESMRSNGTRRANQGAVWKDIEGKAIRLNSLSPTGAMSAIFERHASSLEEFARAFEWKERQCGVLFVIAGRIVGFEIFDYPEVMRKLFKKLLRSYALDALDSPAANEPVTVEAAHAFIAQTCATQSFAEQALGHGKDVRFNSREVSGAALWALDRFIHISAFARNQNAPDDSGFWTRLTRLSDRSTFRK